jgi:uncharacterized membrane-anchored protein YhcB (DUF1043 family)
MMVTYLFAAAFALVVGIMIGAVEYYYLQKDREYDERR